MEALEGLRGELGGKVTVFYLNTNPELVKRQLQEEPHRVVVAVGPEAAELLYNIPIKTAHPVVAMVLDPEAFLGQSPLCGVDLRVPFSEQFRLIAEKMGKGLRIGIPFNPQENQGRVDAAQIHAKAQGCTLFPIPVRSREEVAAQLTAAYTDQEVFSVVINVATFASALYNAIDTAMVAGTAAIGRGFLMVSNNTDTANRIDNDFPAVTTGLFIEMVKLTGVLASGRFGL